MKDTKFYPLLTLSVIFLIASLIMLCILGYNYFNRPQPVQPIAETKTTTIVKPAVNITEVKTRDTLQKMYDSAITGLTPDAVIDAAFKTADTAQLKTLDNKLSDVYQLKNDISTLLKDSNGSVADLELARLKIKELQLRVDDLKNRNIDIENENKRLHTLLEALVKNNGTVTNTKTSTMAESNTSAVFSASELKLAAADDDDAEVSNAEETEKFVGSVVVRNTLNQGTSEVMLVLIQPDGKVLRSAWESGSFDADGGKKIYSRKIKFDYSKGEFRRLDFSVPLDSCQKGMYTLQLYSKGKIIGKAVKVMG